MKVNPDVDFYAS